MHIKSSGLTKGREGHNQKVGLKAWIVILTASLFFFYEFIQMNMLDAISQSLLDAFHITADQLGDMSSYYFLANVIFLLIAGTLLDRFSTRKIILGSLGICIVGTALFGFSTSFAWVTVCRFLTGIGSAFCFLSVLRLASRWFTASRMAFVTGMIVTIAMVGGMVAQTPFKLLVDHIGWRNTLYVDALFGLVVWLLIAAIVRDFPAGHSVEHEQEQQQLRQIGYWKSAKKSFLSTQNWLCGIYTSTMNLPLNVLGGLWGIMYLKVTHHMSGLDASYLTMMLFVGMIFGSPISGWLSDRIGRRKPLMIYGAVISIVLIAIVTNISIASFGLLLCLFLAVGFFLSTQIIGYPVVAESSERIVTAMSISVVNITTMAGIGIIQRLYGFLLQRHAESRVHFATTHYVASDFQWAMNIFLVGFLIALFASLLVKETYCVQRED